MTDRDKWDMAQPPTVESTPRWIRAALGGRTVADSKRAMLHLVYGPPLLPDDDRRPQLPGYFFPTDDVDTAFYNEKVELEVDGDVLERPVTPWS